MPPVTRTKARVWQISPACDARSLSQSLGVNEIVAAALYNRGIRDKSAADSFINPRLTDLIEPELMPGIAPAVQRLCAAIEKKEKITIYGDYDVDGITSIAILWYMLRLLGADVDYYIPHRVEEGYGVNCDAVRQLATAGTQLIVTVDCGVTAVESVATANSLGIDVIVTDHHQPGPQLPQACAIVHPRLDSSYPNQEPAGACVAFKLAWAIAKARSGGKRLDDRMREFLLNATMFAAIGTVADVVPLLGENRIIAGYGLKSLARCKLQGIKALIDAAGLAEKDIDSYHVGFRLAPMLNAAGRMGHARLAVELLTSDDQWQSLKIADYLKKQNLERRACEKKIFKEACEIINTSGLGHPDRNSIVLASDAWHIGVIGIVASRIVEAFHRPTILINTSNGSGQGSGRSVPGLDILAAINSAGQHLERFGGHAMAAGLTICTENVPHFADSFEAYCRANFPSDFVAESLPIDAVTPIGSFNEDVVRQLQKLGPFGQGNPQPVFASMNVRMISPPKRVGAGKEHLQIAVSDPTGAVRCVGFDMGHLEKKLLDHDYFSIAYEAQINEYNGTSSVQFVLRDVQLEQ